MVTHVEYTKCTFNMLTLLSKIRSVFFLRHLYLKLHVVFFINRILSLRILSLCRCCSLTLVIPVILKDVEREGVDFD